MYSYSSPAKLRSSRAWRTYIGGKLIDALHGVESEDSQFPEEWIISTVTARNACREDIKDEGMCYLEKGGVSLLEYINQDPVRALGKKHCEKVGEKTGVLVKLLDAGERLTIQAHPTKPKARLLFNSEYGKTECWHIVDVREINGEKPCIYMGFKEGITREEWKNIFDRQDIPAMLEAMHRFDVAPGETYLIKGGVPHAIGAGCLLIEIQEPTDYTIRTEKITPAGLVIDEMMLHQGIGFEKMFDVFEYDGLTKEQAYKEWHMEPKVLECCPDYIVKELIGSNETSCFRLERYDINGKCTMKTNDEFYGLYYLSGRGKLVCGEQSVEVRGGDQFFVPATSQTFTVEADEPITVFRCYGPDCG